MRESFISLKRPLTARKIIIRLTKLGYHDFQVDIIDDEQEHFGMNI